MKKYFRKIKNNKELILLIIGIWVVFFFFNMYMLIVRVDDLVYVNRLDKLGYLGVLIEYYKIWSLRVIIELFLMFFFKYFMLWKLLNLMIMIGFIVLFCKYVFNKLYFKNLLLVFFIFCLIFLIIMGEIGWIVIMLNY